MIEVFW